MQTVTVLVWIQQLPALNHNHNHSINPTSVGSGGPVCCLANSRLSAKFSLMLVAGW